MSRLVVDRRGVRGGACCSWSARSASLSTSEKHPMSRCDGHFLRQLVAMSRRAGLVLAIFEYSDGCLAHLEMLINLGRRDRYSLFRCSMFGRDRSRSRCGSRLLLRRQACILITPFAIVPYEWIVVFVIELVDYYTSFRSRLYRLDIWCWRSVALRVFTLLCPYLRQQRFGVYAFPEQ